MKKIKSIIAIVLVIVLTISVNVTVYAINNDDYVNHKIIETNGYSFRITEKISKNHNITRTYNKDITINHSANDLNETKALLVSLGMDDESVNELSIDTLQAFSDSLNIMVTTSYTKYNEENNTSTQVSESAAITEANKIQSEYELSLLKMSQNLSAFSTSVTKATEPAVYKDSYMKVTHAVAYKGSGSYLFSVDAEWLTMPIFRGYDSIGSCAMNCTVTPNTAKGHYSYNTTIVDSWGNITTTNSGNKTITNKQNAIEGNWYGSAGVFNLPNNYADANSSISHTGFKAHYEYKGHVSQPNQANWFNTVGTYDHATIGISFSPSIGIDLGGDVSASIGLEILAAVKSRPAELEIYYKP